MEEIFKCKIIDLKIAFSSSHDLKVLGLSPSLGSLLTGESASRSPFPPPTCAQVLSWSQEACAIVGTCLAQHLTKSRHSVKRNWDPWVAQWFGACLWPRARSWRPGIESHVGLLVHGACFSLCLCLCLSLSLSLCDYHK